MKLSVVIPVYNESNTVLEIIRRVKKESLEKEIIIVDDGSTDGTSDLLKNLDDKKIKVIFLDKNKGKGYALREAFKHVTGDIVIIQDADLEYHPDEYKILIEKIVEGKADVVFGTRFLGAHRVFHYYHYLGNKLINFLANVLLHTNLTDMMTGYKAFKSEVLKKITLEADGFGIEAEITAEVFKRKLRVYEVPISYSGRTYDEGKKIKGQDFFTIVYWLAKSFLRGIDVGSDTLFKMRLMQNYNRWLYKKLKPFLGKRILEIGSGIGTISNYLVSKDRNIILTEINDDYINYLKDRYISNPFVTIFKNNINEKSSLLEEQKVDSVVCLNVLEHIEDDRKALKNMEDLLVEGGHLLLIVPAHKMLFSDFDKLIGHLRRYSKKELEVKLKEAGFEIEQQKYINFLGALAWVIEYKILHGKKMSSLKVILFDKVFFLFVEFIERYISWPFGLSLFVIARKK